MKRVSREEFFKVVKSRGDLTENPVEGTNIAAMQYVDKNGRLVAQAIYKNAIPPQYEVIE